MGRRFRDDQSMPTEDDLRVNHKIRFFEVRVIDEDGTQLGIMSHDAAREIAGQRDLDLVEVAPQSRPPVCRIMDYGKFKYQRAKRQTASTATAIKTIQLRPKTGEHDLETKLANARKFIERGDKVRFVMRMRGREHAYPERWAGLMKAHFEAALGEIAHITTPPSHMGRTISMMVEAS